MANRRGNKRSSGKSGKQPFNGFINVDFNDKERIEVNAWLESRTLDDANVVLCLCERGYKVSVSFSSGRPCWYVSLTGKDTDTRYDGYCVVCSHADFSKAIAVAAYVAEVLLENEALPLPGQSDDLNW